MTAAEESDSTEESKEENEVTRAVSSTYKVIGEFADSNGAGVLGRNTASTGTPIGVEGTAPNAGDGYGLSTPDDARVEGVLDTAGTDFVVEAGTQSTGDARNVVQGHASNAVTDGAVGGTIAGGGFDDGSNDRGNRVTDHYGTIGGGQGNWAGTDDVDPTTARSATVGGGWINTASAQQSTVGGGFGNEASGSDATVGGGNSNVASGLGATVGGGVSNAAEASFTTIAGGGPTDPTDASTRNVVFDDYGTIAGGGGNQVGTDDGDPTSGEYATVSGGQNNLAGDFSATVGGGIDNVANARAATVDGGNTNVANGTRSTVSGGISNVAHGTSSTVGGGNSNVANGSDATVGGGNSNVASGSDATVGGGYSNVARGSDATIGGGFDNEASGPDATVPGGRKNVADGNYSFAAGRKADTNGHAGAFVFGDSSSATITAQNDDEVRSQMPMYAPSFNTTSARTAKERVEPVDPETVLAGVQSLEINSWAFTDTDDGRHIGPMAEDFHDAFDVGDDEGSIPTVDADGVALAAIQGLADRLEAKDERIDEQDAAIEDQRVTIEALDQRIEALKAENDRLRDRLDSIEKRLDKATGNSADVAADD